MSGRSWIEGEHDWWWPHGPPVFDDGGSMMLPPYCLTWADVYAEWLDKALAAQAANQR